MKNSIDITAYEQQLLTSTVSCGFMTCTCEDTNRHPIIKYISSHMLQMLGICADDENQSDTPPELIGNDVYLIIPVEERYRVENLIERACSQQATVNDNITALRKDGSRVYLFVWLTKAVTDDGESELRFVCTNISESYRAEKVTQSNRYVQALKQVYNIIFECDYSSRTIKCIYDNTGVVNRLCNIPMKIDSSSEQILQSFVLEEDCENVKEFIVNTVYRTLKSSGVNPPRITFRALAVGGGIKTYEAVMTELDELCGLICFKSIIAHIGRNSNDASQKRGAQVRELMHITDGIVAFEVEDARIRPLYSSNNVCHFFGYSKDEWRDMTTYSHPLNEFVSKCGISYGEFIKVLENGEAEFEYTDLDNQIIRKVKAICPKAPKKDDDLRYVMLYSVNDKPLPKQSEVPKAKVFIRTFGYFDVFINDSPIAFRNEKSKELFAILVNRRGGYVSSEEAISYLWENEPVNSVTLARYRKVALRLKNILEEYGISDIVESVNGKRRIVAEKVNCDLYDYLYRKDTSKQTFNGQYLTNYSWGETTLGELIN